MSKLAYAKLDSLVTQREWTEGRAEMDEIADLYEGNLPARFDKYFPKSEPKHIINLVRLAHDDLATTIGRLPDLRGEPNNASDAEMKRVGLLEDIGKDYLRISEPNGKQFMWQLAWWLLVRQAIAVVVPDTKHKKPKFVLRDPRQAYPGVKRRAGNQPLELSDIIFKYELPSADVVRMGMAPATEKSRSGEQSISSTTNIIEMIDDQYWIVVSEGGTAKVSMHGLGRVPGYVFQDFSPNRAGGIGQFADQISLMVAISRMITQKLAFADRLVYPVYWVRGHEGNIKMGPYILNKLSAQGEMGVLGPPATLQADRDIAQLERFSRLLNRNPEVRQGEVQTKGAYTSAKTLEQLNEAIDTVVGRYWDMISFGMEYLYECAYMMDEKLWPDVEKPVRSGYIKKRPKYVQYIASRDINGQYHISVDYGFGIGGYQGFLQNLQAHEAGMISRRSVVESMPGVSDVDEMLRTIELEKMDEAGQVQFMTLASQGGLDMILWSKLRKQMAKKGLPLSEVIEKYQEEIQAAAQAANEQGGAEALTAPPGPEAPPEPALPGLPPGALVG